MLNIAILAAGEGRRMRSQLPKSLHLLAGKPLLEHIICTVEPLQAHGLYGVYAHELLPKQLTHLSIVQWILQKPALGTAHAVAQVLPHLSPESRLLILPGDTPLITFTTLQCFIQQTPQHALGLITAFLENPEGYGRIIRDTQQRITNIVEERDATPEQRSITEVNSGIYLVSIQTLKRWLSQLNQNNAQGEYYLTDIIACAIAESVQCSTFTTQYPEEIQGINHRGQLAQLEQAYQQKQAESLLQQGLGLLDPQHFHLRGQIQFGEDVTIDSHVVLEGNIQLGDNTRIGPFSSLRNVQIAADVIIQSHCVIEDSIIGPGCIVGPFARLRPGTYLEKDVKIGNFVELKNTQIATASKINHLSYIGDTTVGQLVNIGAGTITANYDGQQKHRTHIADKVMVGAHTTLVAPITLHEGATIGAGSTLTRDAPANSLSLTRAQQRSLTNWQRPQKSLEVKEEEK